MNCMIISGLLVALVFVAFFLGAWLHEGDIQRSCKDAGHSGQAAWRGVLICMPAKDYKWKSKL